MDMNFDDIFNQFMGGGGGKRGGPGGGFHFNMGGHGGGHHGEPEAPPDTLFQNSDVIQLDLSSVFQFYRRKEIWTILFYNH